MPTLSRRHVPSLSLSLYLATSFTVEQVVFCAWLPRRGREGEEGGREGGRRGMKVRWEGKMGEENKVGEEGRREGRKGGRKGGREEVGMEKGREG